MTFPVPFMVIAPNRFEVLSPADQTNTNTPTFSVDLGAAGTKQVIVAFAMRDAAISDGFTVSATLDGDAMTELQDDGLFDGVNTTIAASLYVIETTKGGVLNIVATVAGFTGTLDRCSAAVFVATGLNPTPIDTLSDSSALGGYELALDTTGATLVVVAGSRFSGTVGLSGGGALTSVVAANSLGIAYDRAPDGDPYTSSGNVLVGASFGP